MNGTKIEFNGLSYTIVGRDGEGYYILQCNYFGELSLMHPESVADRLA